MSLKINKRSGRLTSLLQPGPLGELGVQGRRGQEEQQGQDAVVGVALQHTHNRSGRGSGSQSPPSGSAAGLLQTLVPSVLGSGEFRNSSVSPVQLSAFLTSEWTMSFSWILEHTENKCGA